MPAPVLLRLAVAGAALVTSAGVASAAGTPAAAAPTGACTTATPARSARSATRSCRPRTASGKDINCGYIGGGLPFGEVSRRPARPTSRTFSTGAEIESEDETPPTFRLDDAQALTAKVVVQAGSQQGQALPGAGQITVELDVVGTTLEGESVDLGSRRPDGDGDAAARTVEVSFTFDLPDAAGDADLVGVSATLTTRACSVHGSRRWALADLRWSEDSLSAAGPA